MYQIAFRHVFQDVNSFSNKFVQIVFKMALSKVDLSKQIVIFKTFGFQHAIFSTR